MLHQCGRAVDTVYSDVRGRSIKLALNYNETPKPCTKILTVTAFSDPYSVRWYLFNKVHAVVVVEHSKQIVRCPLDTSDFLCLDTATCFGCLRPPSGHQYSILKWPGRGVDHPPLSKAEVKERVELYTSTPPLVYVACSRVNFTFTFYYHHHHHHRLLYAGYLHTQSRDKPCP